MSIKNFSEHLFCRIFDGNETLKIAVHSINNAGEIGSIRVFCYLQGTLSNGTAKLLIYPKDNTNKKVCESLPVNLADIGTNFLGKVRFDFLRNNIPVSEIDIYIELSGHTRNGDINFFSVIYDFPVPIYDNLASDFDDHPISLEDFLYI